MHCSQRSFEARYDTGLYTGISLFYGHNDVAHDWWGFVFLTLGSHSEDPMLWMIRHTRQSEFTGWDHHSPGQSKVGRLYDNLVAQVQLRELQVPHL